MTVVDGMLVGVSRRARAKAAIWKFRGELEEEAPIEFSVF